LAAFQTKIIFIGCKAAGYNERMHSALDYKAPIEIYKKEFKIILDEKNL